MARLALSYRQCREVSPTRFREERAAIAHRMIDVTDRATATTERRRSFFFRAVSG
jgi:hypothetical protein